MDEVLFSRGNGEGLVMQRTEETEYIDKVAITMCNEELTPDRLYDVSGLWDEPYRYCGIMRKDGPLPTMVFEVTSDLFQTYYVTVAKVSEFRVFRMFSRNGGSDFNYKNGKWK